MLKSHFSECYFKKVFSFKNMKKPYGKKSGEYGEWFNTDICDLTKNYFPKLVV
jgi:hypothetical protein